MNTLGVSIAGNLSPVSHLRTSFWGADFCKELEKTKKREMKTIVDDSLKCYNKYQLHGMYLLKRS